MRECEVCGRTDKDFDISRYKGMVLCRKHITQYWRHHTFLEKTIYSCNEYILHEEDGFAEIVLNDKECNVVGIAKIDLCDVEKCKKYKWHMKKSRHTNYAISTTSETSKIFLHRLILDYNGNMDIDHVNHDGLDNRKSNLKICSHAENITNQYKKLNGVRKVPSGRYRAVICVNAKSLYLGTYDTVEEALSVRKNKEYELFG